MLLEQMHTLHLFFFYSKKILRGVYACFFFYYYYLKKMYKNSLITTVMILKKCKFNSLFSSANAKIDLRYEHLGSYHYIYNVGF